MELALASFLVLAALVVFFLAARRRKASGLPGGRIIYSDTRFWNPLEEPLYDPALGLTGKPDYLVEKGDQIIPVEVKTSRAPRGPYDTHIFQLAAYCLLVHRVFGKRPAYGILHYSHPSGNGRSFVIDYTPSLESALLDTLQEMRMQERKKDLPRSHNSVPRCSACGFRSTCDQRLH
jgi:CRISPR-associated exonuclease Cas4